MKASLDSLLISVDRAGQVVGEPGAISLSVSSGLQGTGTYLTLSEFKERDIEWISSNGEIMCFKN